jgi:hypothetical protein
LRSKSSRRAVGGGGAAAHYKVHVDGNAGESGLEAAVVHGARGGVCSASDVYGIGTTSGDCGGGKQRATQRG